MKSMYEQEKAIFARHANIAGGKYISVEKAVQLLGKDAVQYAINVVKGYANMAACYKKLWKMLIDKDMIKKDLRLQTGFSTTTMSKLSKDENVSMDVLEKICSVLNCDVGDIMEFVPDKKEEP